MEKSQKWLRCCYVLCSLQSVLDMKSSNHNNLIGYQLLIAWQVAPANDWFQHTKGADTDITTL